MDSDHLSLPASGLYAKLILAGSHGSGADLLIWLSNTFISQNVKQFLHYSHSKGLKDELH